MTEEKQNPLVQSLWTMADLLRGAMDADDLDRCRCEDRPCDQLRAMDSISILAA